MKAILTIQGKIIHLEFKNDNGDLILIYPDQVYNMRCAARIAHIKVINNGLKENTNLKDIPLTVNIIKSDWTIVEWTEIINDVFKQNIMLTHLNIFNNQLGPEGGKAIADFILENKSLISIGLWNNQLKFEGIKAIADVLICNQTLREFHLSDITSEYTNYEKIANILRQNKTLFCVKLELNIIKVRGAKVTYDILKYNYSITKLYKYLVFIEKIESTIEFTIESNKNDLIQIAKAFLDNKDMILNGDLCIDLVFNEEYSNLRVAIEKSRLVSKFLVEALLTGKIKNEKINEHISNQDADKIAKNIDIFIKDNSLQFAGVGKDFESSSDSTELSDESNSDLHRTKRIKCDHASDIVERFDKVEIVVDIEGSRDISLYRTGYGQIEKVSYKIIIPSNPYTIEFSSGIKLTVPEIDYHDLPSQCFYNSERDLYQNYNVNGISEQHVSFVTISPEITPPIPGYYSCILNDSTYPDDPTNEFFLIGYIEESFVDA